MFEKFRKDQYECDRIIGENYFIQKLSIIDNLIKHLTRILNNKSKITPRKE
ncbi:MAG TPA: hypothetical protein VJ697_15180 [Nitrososphaeraceae archaeon]|nr:hypothetical protein [Nitrososphaeraceae archaeon]